MNVSEVTGSISGLAIITAIKLWYNKIKPIITPMIKEAENDAKDGIIDKADRKHIVMVGIKEAEKNGYIKLNIISRFFISKVVDFIATRLPDFETDKED
jgi:hypothetical protein